MMLDPEAARMVFEAGVPLTMVPLEVTHTVRAAGRRPRPLGMGWRSVCRLVGARAVCAAQGTSSWGVGHPRTAAGTSRDLRPTHTGIPTRLAPRTPHDALASTQALVTPAVLASMVSGGGAAAAPSRFMASAAQMLVFFAGRYREMEGFRDPPLHDPCAVAYVIAPELFKVRADPTPPACAR